MSETTYILTTSGELYHYGVKGMKWGVRRGIRELNEANRSESKGGHNHAVATLSSHRDKINKKITKLDSQYEKLQSKRDKQIAKSDVKAAKMANKAAKIRSKQNGIFTSDKKAAKLDAKASALETKVSKLTAKSNMTKAKIAKNRNLTSAFKKGLSEIDNELVTKGQDFLYMKRDAVGNSVPYTLADD